MDPIFSEPDRTEPEISRQPIEVNVIILDANGDPVTPLSTDPTNQHERNASAMKKSETERMCTVVGDSNHTTVDDDVIITMEDDIRTEESDNTSTIVELETIDKPLKDELENIKPNIEVQTTGTSNPKSSKANDKSSASCTKERHTKRGNTNLEDSYGTLNTFLNELYENKLALHNKFSKQEVSDIGAAVQKQVSLIAQRIYEIDSRLKVREVIPVGSSRENTQIIRPCEFDFIYILDALSKPGAVLIEPEDIEGSSREYMHVKMVKDDVKSVFHEFSDNGYILASRWLPWKRRGLRDLFSSAVSQAVVLGSRSTVRMKTGVLKLKRSKPKRTGPATTIRLLWESETNKSMKISVDLCSAIKVDVEEYYRLLPSSDKTATNDMGSAPELLSADNSVDKNEDSSFEPPSSDPLKDVASPDDLLVLASSNTRDTHRVIQAQSTEVELSPARERISNVTDIHLDPAKIIDSVLLMPRDDLRFKVTFTETELQFTSHLSGHHKTCYKLLKYFINGEPFPLERGTSNFVDRFLYSLNFVRPHWHSYMIKRFIWDHQYNPASPCLEENDLASCVYGLLSKFRGKDNVMHPLNRDQIIYTSQDTAYKQMFIWQFNNFLKATQALVVFNKIKITTKDEYDFQAILHDTDDMVQHPIKVGNAFLAGMAVVAFTFLVGPILARASSVIVQWFLFLLFFAIMVYLLYARGAVYSRWALLARRFPLCTKHIDFWLFTIIIALSFGLILVNRNNYESYLPLLIILFLGSVLTILFLKYGWALSEIDSFAQITRQGFLSNVVKLILIRLRQKLRLI